jgi:phage shock protein C
VGEGSGQVDGDGAVNDRLYRSRDDRMIAGVAGGLAESLGLDPSLVRVAWVILALVTGGLLALVYVVMMFVVPEEPTGNDAWAPWQTRDAGRSPGATASPWQPDATGRAPTMTGTGARGGAREGAAAFATPTPPSTSGQTTAAPGGDRPTEAIPPPPARDAPASAGVGRDEVPPTRREFRDQDRLARREQRAARRAERRDGNSGSVIFGLLLVVVGAWFLARQYLPAVDFDRLWPFGLVAVGVVLVVLSLRPSRRDG